MNHHTWGYIHIGTHNLPGGVKTVNEGGQRTYRRKSVAKVGIEIEQWFGYNTMCEL